MMSRNGSITDAKEDVINYAKISYEESKKLNDAYRAWDICYKRFYSKRNNKTLSADEKDYLQLNLGMYLANWGMYRGSGFIRDYCYREYEEIVNIIYKNGYADLFDGKLDKKHIKQYEVITEELQEEFNKLTGNDKGATQTLITKVLLGTMGCMPAYDTYFCAGVKYYGLSGTYPGKGCKAINDIIDFYDKYETEFEAEIITMKNHEDVTLDYTQAKFLDMGFFKIGERRLLFKEIEEFIKKNKEGTSLKKSLKNVSITNDRAMVDSFSSIMKDIAEIKINKHLFYYEGKNIENQIAIKDLGNFLKDLQ